MCGKYLYGVRVCYRRLYNGQVLSCAYRIGSGAKAPVASSVKAHVPYLNHPPYTSNPVATCPISHAWWPDCLIWEAQDPACRWSDNRTLHRTSLARIFVVVQLLEFYSWCLWGQGWLTHWGVCVYIMSFLWNVCLCKWNVIIQYIDVLELHYGISCLID